MYCYHNKSSRHGHLEKGLHKFGFLGCLPNQHLELPETKIVQA